MFKAVRMMLSLMALATVMACALAPTPAPDMAATETAIAEKVLLTVTAGAPTAIPTSTPIPTSASQLPTSPTATPLPTPTPQTRAEVTPISPTAPPPVPTATPEGVQWGIQIQGPSPGLRPSYLPEALSLFEGMQATEQGTRLFFGDPGGQWLIIDQSQAPTERSLPEGQRVQVNRQEAVLLTGQSGVEEWLPISRGPGGQQGRPEPQKLKYENATRLVWYAGDTRIEMLSNLDVQEMLKVAESMR